MRLLLLLFIVISSNSLAQENASVKKSILELSAMADFQCLNLEVIGICVKPDPKLPIGVKIRYFQPEVFMETVKMPGDYVIMEYGATLKSLAKTVVKTELELVSGEKPLVITSGNSSNSLSGSNLQFNEVHLYDYPFITVLDAALCSDTPNNTLGIRYLTEMDAIAWRKGDIEKKLPQSLLASRIGSQCHQLPLGAAGQCMKNWGPLYPRQGFNVSASQPVGSILDAMRSISIAGDSLPLHVVESKLGFQPNLPKDKVQMLYPTRTACFPIGKDPAEWEDNKQSKDGHYVWIYWHQRQCCVF
jgi:hypothetical protein